MGQYDLVQTWLQRSRRLRVGDCRVDLSLNEVIRDGVSVRLTPKASGVLEVLLFIAGQPASKEHLLSEVWRGECPTDDVVTHAIGELRRAFGDDPRTAAYIRTVPRVGYALVAPVQEHESPPSGLAHKEQSPAQPDVGAEPASGPVQVIQWPWLFLAAALLLVALAWVVSRSYFPSPAESAVPADSAVVQDAEAGATNAAVMRAAGPAPLVLPITYLPGREEMPNLSPDGSLVAFSAQPDSSQPRRIYLQAIDGGSPQPISTVDVEHEGGPVFSPDGRRLVFQRIAKGSCTYVIASVLGGSEQLLGPCNPRVMTHVDWTPDSRKLLLPMVSNEGTTRMILNTWDTETGVITPLDYDWDEESNDVQARYSPDGKLIAFRRGVLPTSDLFVMNADGTGQRQLTQLGSAIRGFDWNTESTVLLFASDHDGGMRLWRVLVSNAEVQATNVRNVTWPDTARSREMMVFTRGTASSNLAEAVVDAVVDQPPRIVAQSSRADWMPSYAPDGRQLAFLSSRLGEIGVYITDERDTRQVSLHGDAEVAGIAWSPDSRQLSYVVQGGGGQLFLADVGALRAREITPEGFSVSTPTFVADGSALILGARRDGERQSNLWRYDLATSHMQQLTRDGGVLPQLADDDSVVYLASNAGEAWRRLQLSTGRRIDPGFDGVAFWNHTAWIARPEGIYSLQILDQFGLYWRGWDDDSWHLVEPVDYNLLGDNYISVSRDGKRFAYELIEEPNGDVYRIEGSINAAPGVARKSLGTL